MANKNEVLDADKQMHEIIESLEKMKSAAEMLSKAENDTVAITDMSKEIIEKIHPFIDSGNKILSSIESYDTKKEIDKLNSLINDLSKNMDGLKTQISSSRTKNNELIKNLEIGLSKKINGSQKIIKKEIEEIPSKVTTIVIIMAVGLLILLSTCSGGF
tara:strand:- start:159 stop:635 length:477 start_codon:yes stop_codon:yes gene_type:complete